MADARQQIVDTFDMATGAAQKTITRKESVRVREAFLTGTLEAGASTRVYAQGLYKPVMLCYLAQVESATADNWVGQEYLDAASAGDAFKLFWDGPSHGVTPNSFLFGAVGANLQGNRYRIWFRYIEREP